ncbi:DinB family protein [Actinocorallia longicatena]|uniref:DinB family protein n=1 Tax=Actinocorallia longicatena TaxID=111803 RepID=A0ABP6QI59_9ACTN
MTRTTTPFTADERTTLPAFLDLFRETVAAKCEGLSEPDAHRRLLPDSPDMSVAGLVSHLRWVEHYWFEHVLLGRPDLAPWTDEDPDADFRADGLLLATVLAAYEAQTTASRRAVADLPLDTIASLDRHGSPVSLRWIMIHMIEETARHAGHLDILRELLDGTRGE